MTREKSDHIYGAPCIDNLNSTDLCCANFIDSYFCERYSYRLLNSFFSIRYFYIANRQN